MDSKVHEEEKDQGKDLQQTSQGVLSAEKSDKNNEPPSHALDKIHGNIVSSHRVSLKSQTMLHNEERTL